jgi:hypothetical protein
LVCQVFEIVPANIADFFGIDPYNFCNRQAWQGLAFGGAYGGGLLMMYLHSIYVSSGNSSKYSGKGWKVHPVP